MRRILVILHIPPSLGHWWPVAKILRTQSLKDVSPITRIRPNWFGSWRWPITAKRTRRAGTLLSYPWAGDGKQLSFWVCFAKLAFLRKRKLGSIGRGPQIDFGFR